MAPSLQPAVSPTESRKRNQVKEVAYVAVKREKKTSEYSFTGDDDSDDRNHTADLETPAALNQYLAKLHQSSKLHLSTNSAIPRPASAEPNNSSLFDRPSPLVMWEPRSSPVNPQDALHQQRQKKGRFYTQDSYAGRPLPSFFSRQTAVNQVVLMMETTLGKEYHGDDRCQGCVDLGIACVRYIDGAKSQIRNPGSTCAWCRFSTQKSCSKATAKRKSGPEERGGKGDIRPTLHRTEKRIRSTIETMTGTTATSNDTRSIGARTSVPDVNTTIIRPGFPTSQTNARNRSNAPARSRSQRNSSDHHVLRLEALLAEMEEDDAHEARAVFGLIRRNLEKGRETKHLVGPLISLFAPLEQRIAGEYDRLSNELARVAQQKRLFDELHVAADGMNDDE